MEKNVYQQDDVSSYDNEKSEKTDLDLEKATIEHEFSSPWDDSDLVLVVEDQKLHVHRAILRMTSPVFKAMLSSDFKEKDAKEITLPGKKADEFVDFLRQIYPLLDSEITLKNIKYIYRLADEYQMPKLMQNCRMFLSSVRTTRENAMDMLLLAQDLEAEEARRHCYDVLNKMTLTELERMKGFSELDGKSMQTLLVPMVKRLQQCVKQILPEFLGSLDGMMHLWSHGDNKYKMRGVPSTCPKHPIKYTHNIRTESLPDVNVTHKRIKCDSCRVMFSQMAEKSGCYVSPSCMYLSENILSVLEEMMDLIKEQ